MARKKISEFRAKTILSQALGLAYEGLMVDTAEDWQPSLKQYTKAGGRYVVKVDQGVKGRFKKGLVKLDRTAQELTADVPALAKKGFRYFIVEPYQTYDGHDERYLALTLEREGDVVTWSERGGVDVEQQADGLQQRVGDRATMAEADQALGVPKGMIGALRQAMVDNYWSFLEINPLVVVNGVPRLLDAAVEADEEAAPFVQGRWTAEDFRGLQKSAAEEAVALLATQSQASFRLEVLNPDGAAFLLLSGGGASVVLADEVFNRGYGKELGNYGEYSGNPSEEETYLYAQQIINLMLASKARRKVFVIGGGVANFTDVRVTFRGVVRALGEAKAAIRDQHIRVFVRRGGPYEEEGLKMMSDFLKREDLLGLVAGPDMMLVDIIPKALATIKGEA